MGFRFSKRINLGNGFGLNISKSGISPGFSNQFGSFNTKGYSLKTGIPGLSYRKSRGGCVLAYMIYIGIVIVLCQILK